MSPQLVVFLLVLSLLAWAWWRARRDVRGWASRTGLLHRFAAPAGVFEDVVRDVMAALRPGLVTAVRAGSVAAGYVTVLEPRATARGVLAEVGPLEEEVVRQAGDVVRTEVEGSAARWRGTRPDTKALTGLRIHVTVVPADVDRRTVVVARTPEAAAVRAEEIVCSLSAAPPVPVVVRAPQAAPAPAGAPGDAVGRPAPRVLTRLRRPLLATDPDPGAVEVAVAVAGTDVAVLPLRVGATLTLGRDEDADLQVPDTCDWVSGRHLQVRRTAAGVHVRDTSRFGTWLRKGHGWTPLPGEAPHPVPVGGVLALDEDATVTVRIGRARRPVGRHAAAGGAGR